MSSKKNPVGRPRKYATPEQFDEKVVEYNNHCRREGEPVTWTGLALYLGFYGRQELDNYGRYPEFSDSVKRAKSLVEHNYEKRLHAPSASGAIFALKNMGWSDRHEIDHTTQGDKVGGAKVIDASKLSTRALEEILKAKQDANKQ